MLQPSRTKFRKAFKGKIKGNAKGGTQVSFGEYGLKAMEPERVTARQIESARRAMTRSVSRGGRVWVLLFPDVPVTKKPAEVRMGSGKGGLEYYVARVKPGQIFGLKFTETLKATKKGSSNTKRVKTYTPQSKDGEFQKDEA